MATEILVDTNAVMAIGSFKLDVFAAIKREFAVEGKVLSGVVDELKKIRDEGNGADSLNAKLGLALLKVKKVEVIQSKGHVDDVLVEYSKKGWFVLTQDKELKEKLAKPYLTIRQKSKIIVVA